MSNLKFYVPKSRDNQDTSFSIRFLNLERELQEQNDLAEMNDKLNKLGFGDGD